MTEKIEHDLINWGRNNFSLECLRECPINILINFLQLIYDETGEEANDVKKFCDWFNDTWNILSGELTNETWTKCSDGRTFMINNYIVLKRIFEIIKSIFSLNKSFKYFIENYNVDVVTTWDTGNFKVYPFYCPAVILEK